MSNLVKYSPVVPSLFSHRDEFVTSFDRLFNQIFEDVFPETTKELGVDLFSRGAYPKVNVADEDLQVVISAEVPGLTKDQVKVEVQNDVLTIRGEKRENVESTPKKKYIYKELKESSFSRSFQLYDNLDVDKIKAKFENGVLELTIPKKVSDTVKSQIKTVRVE
jgi:HSP20 family protein